MPIVLKKKTIAKSASKVQQLNTTSKADALMQLIADKIATAPFHFEGFDWCAMPQPDMAVELGFSVPTLQRLLRKSGNIVRERTHGPGETMVALLRIGEPGPKTPRHLANIMAKIWDAKFGFRPSDENFGKLVGLAEVWPDGCQIEIFKLIISKEGWPDFMSCVKAEIMVMEDAGEKVKFHFYKRPVVGVMRRFAAVAVEFYEMTQQANGKGLPF
jgi:hypothetical protein